MPEVVESAAGFRLKGWHVLAIFLGVFSVVISVNAYFAYIAITTLRGLDERNAYERGRQYERDVDAAQVQENLHWTVDIKLPPGSGAERAVTVSAVDKDNHTLTGLKAELDLAHPTDARKDLPVALRETAPGVYSGAFAAEKGRWYLRLVLSDSAGKARFRSRNVVNLQ